MKEKIFTEPFNQEDTEVLAGAEDYSDSTDAEAEGSSEVPDGTEGVSQDTQAGEDAAPDEAADGSSDEVFYDTPSDAAEDEFSGDADEPGGDVFSGDAGDQDGDVFSGGADEPFDDVFSGQAGDQDGDVLSGGADGQDGDVLSGGAGGQDGDVLSGGAGEPSENASSEESDEPPRPKRRKRYIIPLIIVAIFAISVAAAYQYANALNRPRIAVADFLDAAAELDFEKVESMTQSGDMSVLSDADVQLPVFHEFFLKNNQKLTYKVTNTKLNLGAGTSQVTMHLRYLDNTDVYRQALSELLRQVVEQNLSEDISNNTEMQKTILSLLREKSAELDEKFMETDVVYNLIKVDGEWKVVSLDRETLRAISSNCVSIQDEIDRLQAGSNASVENRHLSDDTSGSFNLDTDDYSISYASHEVGTDFSGRPCLLLYYDYTNKSDYPAGALMDVSITVFQHGKECPAAIPDKNINETDSFLKAVAPGKTARICQAFTLQDLSDVTVQSYEGVHLAEGNIHSVVIHLDEKAS